MYYKNSEKHGVNKRKIFMMQNSEIDRCVKGEKFTKILLERKTHTFKQYFPCLPVKLKRRPVTIAVDAEKLSFGYPERIISLEMTRKFATISSHVVLRW
jgi:hypothetical protein